MDIVTKLKQAQFLMDSNRIEGEEWEDLPHEAMTFALAHIHKNIHPGDILNLHKKHQKACEKYHGKDHTQFGKLRKYDVRVGAWLAPHPEELKSLIAEYCADWHEMDSWQAHVRFEKIHPFGDLNGRVGRLLWLIKALEEGYNYSIPFLQKFYYQTLKKYGI